MKIIQRLKQYIDSKEISLNGFDKSIDASNGYIGKLIKNNGSLGGDVIEKIVCIYTDLNIVWLITGEGSMLKENTKVQAEIQPATVSVPAGDGLVDYLKEQLKEKDKKIEALSEEIGKLRADLEFLKSSNNTTTSQNNAVKLGIGTVS